MFILREPPLGVAWVALQTFASTVIYQIPHQRVGAIASAEGWAYIMNHHSPARWPPFMALGMAPRRLVLHTAGMLRIS